MKYEYSEYLGTVQRTPMIYYVVLIAELSYQFHVGEQKAMREMPRKNICCEGREKTGGIEGAYSHSLPMSPCIPSSSCSFHFFLFFNCFFFPSPRDMAGIYNRMGADLGGTTLYEVFAVRNRDTHFKSIVDVNKPREVQRKPTDGCLTMALPFVLDTDTQANIFVP
ncbi:hypothetical protein ACRALDRAFT_213182 [Sodiomyces alcalophilus JCM 7366]|uniref:uncharacterized protein n=1 Tax=Sodiomyces alcalophilus JCM 7366 TaxID=591952 RepID=UPI0039B3CDF8